MFTTLSSSPCHGVDTAVKRGAPLVKHYLQLTFVSGPKRLLTSRISAKCAAIMVAMCSPALLYCSLLTLPAMIFQSPQQNAYFHFSRILEHDPSRWFVLVLAGLCAVMSLAIPATMPEPQDSEFSLF